GDFDLSFDRVDYDRSCDTVNIIIDRDKSKSRLDDKYHTFLKRCEELKFTPYITNPKFELWILCHYDDVQEVLRSISSDVNPAASLDREMERRGYNKKNEYFLEMIRSIDVAMENSSILESDLDRLISTVGTNIPKLIEALRLNDY
ncbi:MAG: RloB domain-containing protein, partial [Candidatus Methanomethylophilaceae archaeon]|nr:RloB domain-containing protein [Candidatus Methanomethylophilaceae archaeon]